MKTFTPGEDRPSSVLDACEDLHMLATGTLVASIEYGDRVYRWLHGRVQGWKPSPDSTVEYDTLVLMLAKKALREYRSVTKDWVLVGRSLPEVPT